MTSASQVKRPPKTLHIFRFKERYELDGYERKNGLEFTREFTNSGGTKSNEATTYHLQLAELRALADDAYFEALGIFIAVRTMAACYERIYRGYLLDSQMRPLTEKKLALRLHLDAKRLRAALKLLIEVNLIERVECPDFEALAAEEAKGQDNSEDSETFSRSLEKGKGNGNGKGKGNGKKRVSGKGKSNTKTSRSTSPTEPNKQVERQGQHPGQANDQGQPQRRRETAASPTTTPPNRLMPTPTLPTDADAQGDRATSAPLTDVDARGANRPPQAPGPPRSRMDGELDRIVRVLRGTELPEPDGFEQRYSDRAKEFAPTIYRALGLAYGRVMMARELGTFAACWTKAELTGLPPPIAAQLWAEALTQASKLRKKRKLKKPGAMFCRIWNSLLAKAGARSL